MSPDVLVTGFGVRTAFGTGAEPLRRGVFSGVPAFAPTTRFDTGPYRTPMAAAARTARTRSRTGPCATPSPSAAPRPSTWQGWARAPRRRSCWGWPASC